MFAGKTSFQADDISEFQIFYGKFSEGIMAQNHGLGIEWLNF
jgi:hypothetical protein